MLRPEGEDLLRVHIYLGSCYNACGKYQEACRQFEKARQQQRQYAGSHAGYEKFEGFSADGFSDFFEQMFETIYPF